MESNNLILITGASGFIGSRVVKKLLEKGCTHLRCLVRPSSNTEGLIKLSAAFPSSEIQIVKGNLLSRSDCLRATEGVSLIYHLAAGRGGKSYPDAFLNSAVATSNLIVSVANPRQLKRIVSVSSFTVYDPLKIQAGQLLDEQCGVDPHSHLRGEPYCFAKVKQEEILIKRCRKLNIPFVILRPGSVYGPGNQGLPGRVGIGTFGVFLHLGGTNPIPLSYVDNCADAIVLAGEKEGIENDTFNVVDDDLPRSKDLLRQYKAGVQPFISIYVPKLISYLLCWLWELYSKWSRNQLPPVFNRRRWRADWGGATYSNAKLKKKLGWEQQVPFSVAIEEFFEFEREFGADP